MVYSDPVVNHWTLPKMKDLTKTQTPLQILNVMFSNLSYIDAAK